jgi:hypothetical protein
MLPRPPVFRMYDHHKGIEPIGDLFVLRKGAWTLRCKQTTHPLGWELRLYLNDELHRSEVAKTDHGVFDVRDAWVAAWKAKGWTTEGPQPSSSIGAKQ